jgi:hypothetical protein
MRKTTIGVTLGLLLATTALGACGSTDSNAKQASGGYCKELKADKSFFQSLDGDEPDLTRLDQAFERMHALAAVAPTEVAGEWKTLDAAVTTIEGALSDAGLKVDDLASMKEGKVPEGVDLDKLATLGPKMQALSGGEVDEAAARIAKDAKASCGIDLQAS